MSNKDTEARRLAEAHYHSESGITEIYRLRGNPDSEGRPEEPIKLLEVNQHTVPSGILPLRFGPVPARGIHFPSIILEVTPDEFARIRSRDLPLPDGWMVADLFPKPSGNGDA